MSISGPVIFGVPISENANSGQTDVSSNDAISEKHPRCDNWLIVRSWRFIHDIWIGRVERQGGGWEAVSDEVDPQQLNAVEPVWDAEQR